MRHYIKGFSRFSRFLAVFVSFSYFSSYFATTENQVLHAYKNWTGLISKDVLSSADIISSEDINESVRLDVNVNVSLDISEDMTDIADMAVSNDIPASSDIYDDNESDNFVSHDTNDTGNTADTEADTEGDTESDTEGEAEDSDDSADMADSGNTVGSVAPVPSGPDEENNDNTPNNENNDNNPNNPDDSESIAILTTRLTSDHHLIATLSISGVMGADVAVFPNTTGSNTTNATGPSTTAPNTGSDEFTSAGGNIYTVSNVPNTLDTGGSYAGSDGSSTISEDKPDSLLLNFENEEGVVESVRLWLDNEIDETVILDGISIPSDDTINTISNGNDNGSSSNGSNFSSRAADGSNSTQSSQPDQPRLTVPLSPVLSESASSDLAAISDASTDTATAPSVLGHTLESFIGLDQISSPIIVILPSTNEQYYFADGRALAAYDRFDQEYRVLEVRATTRAEIEVRLVRK